MSNRNRVFGGLGTCLLSAAMTCILIGAGVARASAADFIEVCNANAALDNGKLSDEDKKSCECIKGKLDAKAQADAASALEKLLTLRKTGKNDQKPDLTPDEDKAMGAFVNGAQGCVTGNQ